MSEETQQGCWTPQEIIELCQEEEAREAEDWQRCFDSILANNNQQSTGELQQ